MKLYSQVYEILTKIPKGRVTTYGEIAAILGNRYYARAVGNALHNNPAPDRYPCYKVVNSRGMLAENFGFGGAEEQKRRLEADGIKVENNRVDLKKYIWTSEEYFGGCTP